MKSIGVWLMIFGFGSMALNLLGREFVILSWIDGWGTTVGWGIRGALAVVGAVLFVLASRGAQTQQKAA